MINPMWILLLEAGVALSLLILVVWWTKPRKKNKELTENAETRSGDEGTDDRKDE